MATTRIKDLSKTATTVNSDANLVLDGNTGGTQKISRDNFRQDTADAFVAAPGTYNLAPLNSGTGKIDAVYLSSTSDSPKGAWDASSNTPTLADGSGTAGDYYDVTVAGSSDLGSGSIAFTVGDVVKYNGTVWFKIDSVANILDGVSTIDGAKTAIEIPDVGSAANEVSLNGMLGDMAFQSSDGVSVGTLTASGKTTLTNDSDNALVVEATNKNPMYVNVVGSAPNYLFDVRDDDTSKFRVDGSGDVSVGGTTFAAGKLRVEDNNGNHVWLKGRSSDGNASVSFRNNADSAYNGRIAVDDSTGMNFQVAGSTRATIDSSGGLQLKTSGAEISLYNDLTYPGTSRAFIKCEGRSGTFNYGGDLVIKLRNDDYTISERLRITNSALVMGSGVGIDFGSAATSAGQGTGTTGTPANSVLSDYEFGSWTPTFQMSSTNFAALTMDVIAAQYVKIGRHVHCQAFIRTDNVDTTGAGGYLIINGLPFVSDTTASNYAGLTIHNSVSWTNAPTTGYVAPNSALIYLNRNGTTGTATLTASDVVNGAVANQNEIIFTVSYIAST
jgi:hypothetical protein